ncbi:unnamed protein product [Acanthoscelides obtectus]|uniref:Uncharacterized protein n=1 Tax=Acanthoscelides obtectus TaxID=200917 RepID=A0A9P0P4R5_ACAOB|nr:unnamed protein product [Acanthoscelides obtectus]CAK1645704.1 hypothetical protein AOBTE_LOCUS14219 [Acanthoscelides obtectus]
MMAPPTNTGQRVPNCPQDFNTDMYSQGFPGTPCPPQQIQQTSSMPAPPRMSGAHAMTPRFLWRRGTSPVGIDLPAATPTASRSKEAKSLTTAT